MESLIELPAEVRSTWARYAFRLKPHHATIIDLDDWLVEFTAAEEGVQPSCSSSSQQRLPQSPNGSRTGAARSSTSGESKTERRGQSPLRQRVVTFVTQETNNGCEVCKARPGHGLTRCKEFLGMTPTERASKHLWNCFRFLGRGHDS